MASDLVCLRITGSRHFLKVQAVDQLHKCSLGVYIIKILSEYSQEGIAESVPRENIYYLRWQQEILISCMAQEEQSETK